MIHLREAALRPALESETSTDYPFSVPAVHSLLEHPLHFTAPVTFLVGENGSGKSAILEGLACAAGTIAIAGMDPQQDPSLAPARELAKRLRLSWRARSSRGYFLRAEDFFGFAKYIATLQGELEQDLRDFDAAPGPMSVGRSMARGAYLREIGELRRTNATVNETSHGESFLELLQRRFVPRGLYLLDEPETPLSPMRQLSLLAMLRQMVGEGEGQFIIATHSPILMAFPGAEILSLEGGVPHPVPWNSLEHVSLTRDFLNDPEAFLRYLMA